MIIPELRRFGEGRHTVLQRVRSWALWTLPVTARAWLLGIELLAVGIAVALLVDEPLPSATIVKAAILTAVGLSYAEGLRRIERMRRYVAADTSNLISTPMSVWSFAAIVILPPGWAVLCHGVLYAQDLMHSRADRSWAPHRHLFTASAALLAQAGAATFATTIGASGHHAGAVLGFVAAALVYTIVDLAVVVTGMALASGRRVSRAMVPDGDAIGYELSCLALGLCLGELLTSTPWAAPVLLGPVIYLHRSTMIKELRDASRVDAKTGVLNSTAWREHATSVLDTCARRNESVAMFVVDIDNFKAINDTYGHLVGDRVLDQVTATMRSGVRSADAIGRFGGDEFVLVVDSVDFPTAYEIGERIRAGAAALDVDGARVSVSVGLAHISGDRLPVALDDVLTQADVALYEAKSAGRDRLCVAPV